MYRSLIVAKITPGTEKEVARIWAESDATELPKLVRVSRRSLYSLNDLYVHVLETEQPPSDALGVAREHPEFARISKALEPFISPYLPTWQGPKDAVASCFYTWEDKA